MKVRRPRVPGKQEQTERKEVGWRGKSDMDLDCAKARQRGRAASVV